MVTLDWPISLFLANSIDIPLGGHVSVFYRTRLGQSNRPQGMTAMNATANLTSRWRSVPIANESNHCIKKTSH